MSILQTTGRAALTATCSTSATRQCVPSLSSSTPSHATVSARHALPTAMRNVQATGRRTVGSSICRATDTMSKPSPSAIVPLPSVKIDNVSDPFATVVTVEYGEQLGELLDTITALKNMRLNILRAKLVQKVDALPRNVFYITDADTSEKIIKSARLEEIRMVVINSLVASYPESASMWSSGIVATADSDTKPLGYFRKVVPTTIDVQEAKNGSCSLLKIVTVDRPGLLVDIVRALKDISLNVVSAEIDTVGIEASDEFFVTYHGEPLDSGMVLLVTNALQYYLSFAEVAKEESY